MKEFLKKHKSYIIVMGLILCVGALFVTPGSVPKASKPPAVEQPDRTVPGPDLSYFDRGVEDQTDDTVQPTQKVKVLTLTDENTIELNDEISYQSSLDAIKKIKAAQSNGVPRLTLLITSPGGSVLDGAQIIAAIQGSKVPVDTVCVLICASMGAQIHQSGAKRYMTGHSILMFHPASGGFQGEFDTMISRMNFLNRYINKMDAYVAQRAGIPYAEFKKRTRSEYWLDATEATGERFNDGVVYLEDSRSHSPSIVFLVPGTEEKSPVHQYFKGP